ncbi:unnamed protein product [Calypogeia fissa]
METPSVKASIVEKAAQAQEQAATDLQADHRKMLNNEEYSDVVFMCADGERVHACRLLLCARSPVLKSMLMNGMAESRLSEIPLPDITSPVLLSIFEFLYTGTMVEHAPSSWSKALEIIGAAKFFLLENLEHMGWKYLVEGTFEVSPGDMRTAASNLSVAMDFPTLFDKMECIPLELVRILSSKYLEPAQLRLLSQRAFQYLLSKSKTRDSSSESSGGSPTLSLGEYLRFRQIILWCACQFSSEPQEAEDIISPYLPDAKASLLLLNEEHPQEMELGFEWPVLMKELGNGKEGGADGGVSKFNQFLELKNNITMSSSVGTLLSMIDLRRIHPELLIRVMEPLAIIPATQLIAALRFHALQRPRVAKGTWDDTAHASFYRIGEDRSVIEKCDGGIGFARASNAICQPYGVYVWDIVIEELCYSFCEVGIYMHAGKPNFNGASLTQQPSGWALRMDERGTHTNQWNVLGLPWMQYGKKFGYQDARVRVKLDMFHHACSFSIDGQEFGEAWTNLPEGTYYPAVSLGSGALGRVRIELISGFDLL